MPPTWTGLTTVGARVTGRHYVLAVYTAATVFSGALAFAQSTPDATATIREVGAPATFTVLFISFFWYFMKYYLPAQRKEVADLAEAHKKEFVDFIERRDEVLKDIIRQHADEVTVARQAFDAHLGLVRASYTEMLQIVSRNAELTATSVQGALQVLAGELQDLNTFLRSKLEGR